MSCPSCNKNITQNLVLFEPSFYEALRKLKLNIEASETECKCDYHCSCWSVLAIDIRFSYCFVSEADGFKTFLLGDGLFCKINSLTVQKISLLQEASTEDPQPLNNFQQEQNQQSSPSSSNVQEARIVQQKPAQPKISTILKSLPVPCHRKPQKNKKQHALSGVKKQKKKLSIAVNQNGSIFVVDENSKIQFSSGPYQTPCKIIFQKDDPCLTIENNQDQIIWKL